MGTHDPKDSDFGLTHSEASFKRKYDRPVQVMQWAEEGGHLEWLVETEKRDLEGFTIRKKRKYDT